MGNKKPDEKRGSIAFIFVVVLGLLIGIFIKRVQVGLVIGLAFGLFASGLWRKR